MSRTQLLIKAQTDVSQSSTVASQQVYCAELTVADFDRVKDIEPQCYSLPWSPTVLYSEFANEVSLRMGLYTSNFEGTGRTLIGYSFNHLVLDEVHILNLAVEPRFQGRGFGAQLLNETLQAALLQGASRAFLEVRPSNRPAMALYARYGFRRLGIRKAYYRDNSEDAIVMEAYLDSPNSLQVDRSTTKC